MQKFPKSWYKNVMQEIHEATWPFIKEAIEAENVPAAHAVFEARDRALTQLHHASDHMPDPEPVPAES